MSDIVSALRSFPSEQHVEKTCQPGKGAATCRYLAMGSGGWSCEKKG